MPVLLKGQDMMYSQFYANPIFLNPALTGNSGCTKVNFQYRNQWPALQNAFVNYYASFDHYSESIKGGYGLLVNSEMEGNGAIRSNQVAGLYSYKLQASKKLTLAVGFQLAYLNRSLTGLDDLVFGDQLDVNGDPDDLPATLEGISNGASKSNLDISFGLLAGYDERFYLGYAMHHVTTPQIGLMPASNEELAARHTIHAGALFFIDDGLYSKEDVYLSPNVLYTQQGEFHQLNAGMYVAFPYIIFGTWFRHNFENPDAIIALIGIKQKKFKFGYTYDIGLFGEKPGISGAHELSVSYTFCVYKNKRRKVRAIKCPTF
jgi:type IX secretion system PorP/SprF family membrane protein